jgi:HSP20 family molecular chaperone IbpA
METEPAEEEASSEDHTEETAQQEQGPSDGSVQKIPVEVEKHPDEVAIVDERPAEVPPVEEEKPFAVSMDVSGYEPGEVKVEVSDDGVPSVTGFHEERASATGLPTVTRQFKRFYVLPKKHVGEVRAEVCRDGVLKISAAETTQTKEIEIKTQQQEASKQ